MNDGPVHCFVALCMIELESVKDMSLIKVVEKYDFFVILGGIIDQPMEHNMFPPPRASPNNAAIILLPASVARRNSRCHVRYPFLHTLPLPKCRIYGTVSP